ncbi:MAG: VWA domain-containing protein [Sarcina sp.]
MRYKYPFSAIVGQEKLKRSILLNLINPRIGGVLINGQKGVAKSTLVRGLDDICDKKIINIPLNVTEDMLVGSIDIEKTVKNGKLVFESGILGRANNNILYVDEVNLLADNIVDCLLDVCESKINRVEREGISYIEDSNFILMGSMNKEMGELRAEFLDRFPLYVDVKGCEDVKQRVDIIKKILEFERNPVEFIENFSAVDKEFANLIIEAKKILPSVVVTEGVLQKIVKLCIDYGVKGHRADIILEQTVKAIAALNMSLEIKDEYIEEAASYVLAHRATKLPDDNQEDEDELEDDEEQQEEEDQSEDEDNQGDSKEQDQNQKNSPNENDENNSKEQRENHEEQDTDDSTSQNDAITEVFAIGESFKIKEIMHKKDRVHRASKGKRSKTKASNKLGQYLYSTQNTKDNDIAFDATIRAAAPYQMSREKNGMALALRKSDIRNKVRQNKVSNLIVLVVDSSGSIGVNKRMIQVKGAILSMLKDSYVKRDKVSLVLFRGNEAEMILPPTNSVERAYKLLEEIKTGGKTPLNAGLYKGFEVIQKELRKDETIKPMFIVISDGKGNVTVNKDKKVKEEMIEIAKGISEIRQIKSLVIDVEKKGGMMTFDRSKLLAENMEADYIALEDLSSDDIVRNINKRRKDDE